MARHRTIAIVLAVLAAAVLAGAGGHESASDNGTPDGRQTVSPENDPVFDNLDGRRKGLPHGGTDCIFFHSIYDWRAVDRENLIIWAPNRQSPYLVSLDRSCDGLLFTDTIALSSTLDGRLCAFGRDAVIVQHDRCPIGAISKLSKDQLEYLDSLKRKKKNK